MVDTNIIVGVWLGNVLAKADMASARRTFTLAISPIVHTELFAHPKSTEDGITAFLERMGIPLPQFQTRYSGWPAHALPATRDDAGEPVWTARAGLQLTSLSAHTRLQWLLCSLPTTKGSSSGTSLN